MVRIGGLFLFICTGLQLAYADVVSNCVTLLDSADLTASANGTIYNLADFNREFLKAEALTGIAVATNDSGTTPTLDLKIQTCETATSSSVTCGDTPIVFDQCTTGSCYGGDTVQRIDINKASVNAFPFFRVVSTLTGTNPNYDVEVKICYQ
jgi:hypothetical protein